jgi:large subunit ribosomal protein L10
MSKPVKEMLTRELVTRYGQATNAIWVEMVGVDGITTNAFRRDLRARHMRLEVVKTALLQRACRDGPLARLAAALSGPAALVTGGESAIDVAKVLADWLPKLQTKLRVRGAVLDGEYLDEPRAKELAKMPSKHDLQARLVLIILTPGGRVAGSLLSPARRVAGCVQALVKKLEKDESSAAQPA